MWLVGTDTPQDARDYLTKTFEEENPGSTLVIEEQQWTGLVTVFNGTPIAVRLRIPGLSSRFVLHPVQAGGHDPVVKRARVEGQWASVPARSFAVFVEPR